MRHSVLLQQEDAPEVATPIIRAAEFKDGIIEAEAGHTTLWESFGTGAAKARGPAFHWRPVKMSFENGAVGWDQTWATMTYSEAKLAAIALGSALCRAGLAAGDRVAVWTPNCLEWSLAELAANAYSLCLVPIYDAADTASALHVLRHSEAAALVVSPWHARTIRALAPQLAALRAVILADATLPPVQPSTTAVAIATPGTMACAWACPPDASAVPGKPVHHPTCSAVSVHQAIATRFQGRGAGAVWLRWDTARALGEAAPAPVRLPQPDTLATISYTSGTTGLAKGVMLTHRNLAAVFTLLRQAHVFFNEEDVHLSYLPLAHVFERCVCCSVLGHGGAVAFLAGPVTRLLQDAAAVRPTVFVGVPRVYNRVADRIFAAVAAQPLPIRAAFWAAVKIKSALGVGRAHERLPVIEALFARARSLFGGRVTRFICGSAPLALSVKNALSTVLGAPILVGYGMTESAGIGTTTTPECRDGAHVGVPSACCEMKLVAVPEMGYSVQAACPAGEVWMRGAQVTRGYWRDPERTAETITSDGWLQTGDIARLSEDGLITLIDRKRALFKLAQGEFVSPERVEAALQRAPLIGAAWVVGNALATHPVAVLVVDPDAALAWLQNSAGGTPETASSARAAEMLRALPEGAAAIRAQATSAVAHLRGFERPAAYIIESKAWSTETGELTPTMKLKRPCLAQQYAQQLEAVWEELGVPPA